MTYNCINPDCPQFEQEVETELASPICEVCQQNLELVEEEKEEEEESTT